MEIKTVPTVDTYVCNITRFGRLHAEKVRRPWQVKTNDIILYLAEKITEILEHKRRCVK